MTHIEQRIISSFDGSDSVYSKKYNSNYHSIHGAIEESTHVFISAGLYYHYLKHKKQISIFEMGFGTGLNALLTLLEANRFDLKIDYQCVECDPISEDMARALNYCEQLKLNDIDTEAFINFHTSSWHTPLLINDNFKFTKFRTELENFSFESKYDIIYFDAFDPNCQPDLWSLYIHRQLFNTLYSKGTLVTYCSQGAFRRSLKEIGYSIEILNGPSKKREMIRAVKK